MTGLDNQPAGQKIFTDKYLSLFSKFIFFVSKTHNISGPTRRQGSLVWSGVEWSGDHFYRRGGGAGGAGDAQT